MTLRNFTKVIAGVFALAAISFAAPSQAAQPAIDFTGFNHQNIGSNFNIGWEFTVGASAITVSQLGYFDFNQDGLATTHDVAIWTTGGSQVISATVASGTGGSLNGKFRYTTIANTVLTANTTYIISGTSGTVDEFALGSTSGFPVTLTGLTVDPGISLVQSALDNGSNPGLAFANATSSANTLFAGANMIYAAGGGGGGGGGGGVPEPGTVGLLIASGFSSMGLVFRNRKIRK